jgi:hypothetical protein
MPSKNKVKPEVNSYLKLRGMFPLEKLVKLSLLLQLNPKEKGLILPLHKFELPQRANAKLLRRLLPTVVLQLTQHELKKLLLNELKNNEILKHAEDKKGKTTSDNGHICQQQSGAERCPEE